MSALAIQQSNNHQAIVTPRLSPVKSAIISVNDAIGKGALAGIGVYSLLGIGHGLEQIGKFAQAISTPTIAIMQTVSAPIKILSDYTFSKIYGKQPANKLFGKILNLESSILTTIAAAKICHLAGFEIASDPLHIALNIGLSFTVQQLALFLLSYMNVETPNDPLSDQSHALENRNIQPNPDGVERNYFYTSLI